MACPSAAAAPSRPSSASSAPCPDLPAVPVNNPARPALPLAVQSLLNEPLLKALLAAVDHARRNPAVRCAVITGTGRAFSAGGDLKTMLALLESGSKDDLREYLLNYQRLSGEVRRLGKPMIAAINGYALAGGFELACLCDVRIAAETATFGLPDTPLGISQTSGMTYLLPRIVGLGWAKHLTHTDETIDAHQAERIGFVTRVVPLRQLETVALQLARTIASYPPLGVRHAKIGFGLAADADLHAALTYELDAEMSCFAEEEVRANLRALANRKKSASQP
jgi:enoyl-CoA hydratase/carnithine racemase